MVKKNVQDNSENVIDDPIRIEGIIYDLVVMEEVVELRQNIVDQTYAVYVDFLQKKEKKSKHYVRMVSIIRMAVELLDGTVYDYPKIFLD